MGFSLIFEDVHGRPKISTDALRASVPTTGLEQLQMITAIEKTAEILTNSLDIDYS